LGHAEGDHMTRLRSDYRKKGLKAVAAQGIDKWEIDVIQYLKCL